MSRPTCFSHHSHWLGALALLALMAGCAKKELIVEKIESAPPRLYEPEPVSVETGIASYYWEPQPTANGERFNPEAMTAAHKKLPFNTRVRVINLRNGKSVIVRINDRGPYIRGRIIDLSRAAAREIDMIKAGIVPVRVEILKRIPVVEKPNLQLTDEVRRKTKERTSGSE